MRCGIELYRHAFEHEIEANHAMLKMLASVPESNRSDPRFQRALNIAAHMVACRQNFLDIFKGLTVDLQPPFEERADFDELESRFSVMEDAWKDYLSKIDDAKADGDFVFADNGQRWRISLEAQLFQLVGHAAYHRGQVVLLIDSLGGTTFDTDYIEWFTEHHPEGWGVAG
jgi:uncharacterized damage-inducible protein DinB